jgi:hypothetical protein
LRDAGVRAVQSTPFFDRTGRLIGMISTHWTSVWRPSENDLTSLDEVLSRASDFISLIAASEAKMVSG